MRKAKWTEKPHLQALCYRCNAMKRDRDDTDFRAVGETYGYREPGCPFCEVPKERVLAETELACAVRDALPVTPLHTLVIPKRHVPHYIELGRPELNACNRLLEQEKRAIEREDASVKGFNIGVNGGEQRHHYPLGRDGYNGSPEKNWMAGNAWRGGAQSRNPASCPTRRIDQRLRRNRCLLAP